MLKKALVIATLCAAGLVLCAGGAKAQCSARNVLQNVTTPKIALVNPNSAGLRKATALSVWKTITLGEFANSFALRNALDAADCGIGDLAEEILHYFDQPIGEFLHVGMKPISTWKGEPGIFVVANGGAGLTLIGQNGSADTRMPTSSISLFVRPREPPALAKRHAPTAR